MIGFAGLLLSSAPALAQGDKPAATVTPTELPGEENLSAQERAERDFIMPARRKQAAALRTAAREEATSQPAVEATARALEGPDEVKPADATEAKPAAVRHHTTYHRRSSSSHRSTSSSRKKTTSSTRKKTTAHRRR